MSSSCVSHLRRPICVLGRVPQVHSARQFCSAVDTSASTSSGTSRSHPVGFDADLLVSARRRIFRPPHGYTAVECCDRIRELLISESCSPLSLRVTDLLILANAAVSGHADLADIGLSPIDIISLVDFQISKRHRLPNAVAILQFVKFRRLTNSWKTKSKDIDVLHHSIESLVIPRSIDLIELTQQLLIANVSSSSIFSVIEATLRRSLSSDPNYNSPRTKAAALNVVELIYSRRQIDDKSPPELISLSIEIMNGRNCGSPSVLSAMIQLAESSFNDDIPLTNRLIEGIRLHQISRWKSVKSLFENDPSMMTRLNVLLNSRQIGGGVVAAPVHPPQPVSHDPIDDSEEKFPEAENVFDKQKDPLKDWLVDEPVVVKQEKIDSQRFHDLEKQVDSLNLKIFQLEEQLKEMKNHSDVEIPDCSNTVVSAAFPQKFKEVISGLIQQKTRNVVPNVMSFDEYRLRVIREEQAAANRRIVSRKFS